MGISCPCAKTLRKPQIVRVDSRTRVTGPVMQYRAQIHGLTRPRLNSTVSEDFARLRYWAAMISEIGKATTGQARIIRRLQFRLLPFLFALYVVAFIDRINLGFAALTMNRELAITSQQFGLAAGIFFCGYFLFEVPSNLILHKIGARVWIARILLTWGTVATLTGFVQSANQLYIARFALGLAEAGYFPGIVLYLGYWFRQREKAQAIALILMGIPLASVVGAPISGFILDHAHWFGLSSWRWLLILEGLPAIACVFLTYFLLPSRPAEARFLTAEEKAWIAERTGAGRPAEAGGAIQFCGTRR